MKNFLLTLCTLLLVSTLISCENFLEGSLIQKDVERLILLANSEKPSVVSKSPEYKEEGVYKNLAISVIFTHKIDESNFRFTDKELVKLGCMNIDGSLNSGYDILKDDSDRIYAYIYQKQTFFKNITITDDSSNSLCANFKAPVMSSYNKSKNETTIQIPVNELNLLEVENLMKIHVSFSNIIQDTETIPLTSDLTWFYIIKNEIDQEKPVLFTDKTIAALSKESINPYNPLEAAEDYAEQEKLNEASLADAYIDYFNPGDIYKKNNQGIFWDRTEDIMPKRRRIFYKGDIYDRNGDIYLDSLSNNEISHFFRINHINSKVYFYLEGHDYGSGTVNAVFTWERLTDENGNEVSDNIPKEDCTLVKTLNMTNTSDSVVSAADITLDLSDSIFLDGLYKIEIQLCDSSGNFSDEKEVYYVVRDTKMTSNLDQLQTRNDFPSMNIPFPKEKDKATGEYLFDDPESQGSYWTWFNEYLGKYIPTTTPTAGFLNERRRIINIENMKQDYFYTYNKGSEKIDINTDTDRFIFTCDYGLSSDNIIEKNVSLQAQQWGEAKENFEYWTPQALIDYTDANPTSNVYVRINIIDEVNNVLSTDLYFPAKVSLSDYSYSSGLLKLNIADQSQLDWTAKLNLSNLKVVLKYWIFYAEVPEGFIVSPTDRETIFTRNTQTPEVALINSSDNFNIPAEQGKTYSVIIRPEFEFNLKSDGSNGGCISGPITIFNGLKAESKTQNEIKKPTFTLEEKNNGKNSGTFTITANIEDLDSDAGTKYQLAYSTDGTTFNYLYDEPEDIEFNKDNKVTVKQIKAVIPTPIKPPVYAKWDSATNTYLDDNTWLKEKYSDYKYFDNKYGHEVHSYNPTEGKYVSPATDTYTTTVFFKIVASNGNSTVESEISTINFTQDDDNRPPYFHTWKKTHDLRLSPDGKSLSTVTECISDDEWQLVKEFTFYYTPYKEIWGNDLNVLSTEEIKRLPSGKGSISSEYTCEQDIIHDSYYIEVTDSQGYTLVKGAYAHERNYISIPTSCFDSGEYLLFASFTDKAGNELVTTLGKINIDNFKNKPEPSYDSETGKINVTFNPDNKDFMETILSVQYFAENTWNDFFPLSIEGKLMNERIYAKDGNNLSYSTSDNITVKDTFYKIDTQGYNIDYSTGMIWCYSSWEDNGEIKYDNWWSEKNENDRLAEVTQEEIDERRTSDASLKDKTDDEIRKIISDEGYQYSAYDYYTQETQAAPSYVYVSDTYTPFAQENKNFIDGAYGAMLICSQPVLVQFIVSNQNLGSSIEKWELRGTAVDTQLYNIPGNPSATDLTTLKSSVIENSTESFYYVVTVHFADGTQNISQVFQK